ncbi:5811_t:CDS:1, partial [Funneliformis caledonium]
YITEEGAKNRINSNIRKPGKHYKIWGKRLVQKWKKLDLGVHDIPVSLDDCLTLYYDLEQYDSEAVCPPTL